MLGKLPVPGGPTNSDYSRARAYCTCSRCDWGLFGHFSFLSPSLWGTARYRLKYCLKRSINPNQSTNQHQNIGRGGAIVLGKLPVPRRPTIWISVGQGRVDIFTLIYPFFPLSPSFWETARYRLKFCLKGRLNPKPTYQKSKYGEGGGAKFSLAVS